MALVTLPVTSRGPTDVNQFSDVYNNDNAIVTQVNGNLDNSNIDSAADISGSKLANLSVTDTKLASSTVTDTKLASPNNSVYRTVFEASGILGADAIAGTYLLGSVELGSAVMVSSGGIGYAVTSQFTPPSIIYFDDADYTVASKTQKLRLRAQVAANATAPAITFWVGLHPVTVAGTTDAIAWTAGAAVASSTVAIASPSSSTVTSSVNSDLTIPSDGAYVLAVVTSGTIANNSAVSVHAQLQTRHV